MYAVENDLLVSLQRLKALILWRRLKVLPIHIVGEGELLCFEPMLLRASEMTVAAVGERGERAKPCATSRLARIDVVRQSAPVDAMWIICISVRPIIAKLQRFEWHRPGWVSVVANPAIAEDVQGFVDQRLAGAIHREAHCSARHRLPARPEGGRSHEHVYLRTAGHELTGVTQTERRIAIVGFILQDQRLRIGQEHFRLVLPVKARFDDGGQILSFPPSHRSAPQHALPSSIRRIGQLENVIGARLVPVAVRSWHRLLGGETERCPTLALQLVADNWARVASG